MGREILENKIVESLHQMILRYQQIEQGACKYGTDVDIYQSEIHVIEEIANNPGIHIGGLAENLNCTKGAISEIVRKLEKKDLIKKEFDSKNMSRVLIYLTQKGIDADLWHKRYHKFLNEIFKEKVKDKPECCLETINKYFTDITQGLNEFKK